MSNLSEEQNVIPLSGVGKVRETLEVSKETVHRVHIDRFNLNKLNEVEVKEQYHIKISNGVTALENLRC
jgi:hypothetical protein